MFEKHPHFPPKKRPFSIAPAGLFSGSGSSASAVFRGVVDASTLHTLDTRRTMLRGVVNTPTVGALDARWAVLLCVMFTSAVRTPYHWTSPKYQDR